MNACEQQDNTNRGDFKGKRYGKDNGFSFLSLPLMNALWTALLPRLRSRHEPNDDASAHAKAVIEQYKKQRFRVGIYKAGVPFPFGGYTEGEYKGNTGEGGGDLFSFAKIPDNWIEESGTEAQGQGVVLEILLPPILQVHQSSGQMKVYSYSPRIRRPFRILRDNMDRQQVYVFSIRPADLSVRRLPNIVVVDDGPSITMEAYRARFRGDRELVKVAEQRIAQANYESKVGMMLALTKQHRVIARFIRRPLDESIVPEKVGESNELLAKIDALYRELVAEEVVIFKERYNTIRSSNSPATVGSSQNPQQDSANPNLSLSLSPTGKAPPVLQSQTQQHKLTAEMQNIRGIQVLGMGAIVQHVTHQWLAIRKRPQEAGPSSV